MKIIIIYWTRGIHFDNILTVCGLGDLEPSASKHSPVFYIVFIFSALVTLSIFTDCYLRIYFDNVIKINQLES